MKQIPNIEETHNTREVEEVVEHFNNQFTDHDDGTFTVGLDIRYATKKDFTEFIRANLHHQLQKARQDGYNAGLADGTDKPLLAIEQMLQKAREERKGWKGYVAVDPKADNYKYSPVFSDRKGAELWVKGKEINGLEVVEVDILLVDHSELDQDKQ